MRVVDLRNAGIKFHVAYNEVEQPMYVYHSKDEFYENEVNNLPSEEPIAIVDTWMEFGQWMQDTAKKTGVPFRYQTAFKWLDVRPYNVWIKTVDELVPDIALHDGTITYKTEVVNGKNEFIPTDGCYIKLFFITPTPTMFILYTSSGIHAISMTKWDLTAAVRTQFFQEKNNRAGKNKEVTYQENMGKMLRKRKPDVRMIKVASIMLNPASETFLDFEKTIQLVYRSSLKAADRMKLLESPAFKEALMSTIKIMYPSLGKKIKETIPPEELARFLKKMMDISETDGDVDKMLKVIDKVVEVGYTEEVATNPLGLPLPSPVIGELDDPLQPNRVEMKIPPKAEEEELDDIKKDLDYPQSFVMDNYDEEEVEKEEEKE